MSEPEPPVIIPSPPDPSKVARTVLAWFLGTFLASRITVLLIMTGRAPNMFLHVGAAHIHHLNYGIFLLSLVGGAMLLRPAWARTGWARAIYGIGMGLTFDEFGMWVHLGGSYWQRASYDAVITVGSAFFLLGVAPSIRRWRLKHWVLALAAVIGVALLATLMADSFHTWGQRWGEKLRLIEEQGPE